MVKKRGIITIHQKIMPLHQTHNPQHGLDPPPTLLLQASHLFMNPRISARAAMTPSPPPTALNCACASSSSFDASQRAESLPRMYPGVNSRRGGRKSARRMRAPGSEVSSEMVGWTRGWGGGEEDEDRGYAG